MPNAAGEDHVQWERTVPLRYRADVAVIGGGIAGVCAACAAAHEGASVILVERFAVPGGNATVGGVANWSGETAGQGAIFDEIIAMQQEWDSIAPYPGPVDGFANTNRVFDHEILAVILQELLLKHDVRLLLHTKFVDVQCDGAKLGPAVVAGASGAEALDAPVYVDATGGGQVARAAGCKCLPPGELGPIPPSMMYFVRELEEDVGPQLPSGWFEPVEREEDMPMTSTWPAGPGAKALKLKVPGYDSGDTVEMTELEIRARRRMWEVLDFYQRDFRGEDTPRRDQAANANANSWRFDHCSPMIGLRETRRIAGDYVLTVHDVRAGRAFEDGVARGTFYLDGLRPDDEKRTYLLTKDEQRVPPYQIPLRSLIARDAENLLMAGRCLSADQLALSSARVMTTCAMMGQAAGIAAAWTAERGCTARELDGSELRARVVERGANLDV